MKAKGYRLGAGGDRKSEGRSTATVSGEAIKAGVSGRTARNRMKLAEELEPYPETAQKVDRGEVKVKDAMKEAAREAERKGLAPPPPPPPL